MQIRPWCAVARGAKLLDTLVGEGWASKIDLSRLDLMSDTSCVLGQLCGGYGPGLIALAYAAHEAGVEVVVDPGVSEIDAAWYGFMPDARPWAARALAEHLAVAWRAEIVVRVGVPQTLLALSA